jgi:GH43 family beta-xylosidase
MRPTAWIKHPELIFTSSTNVFGLGQQSFTKSLDDKEDSTIYYSARYSGAGWNRKIRAQKFTWNTDATPKLGKTANRNIPI